MQQRAPTKKAFWHVRTAHFTILSVVSTFMALELLQGAVFIRPRSEAPCIILHFNLTSTILPLRYEYVDYIQAILVALLVLD